MSDPKERKFEPEAATLVVSNGVSSVPPTSGENEAATNASPAPAVPSNVPSEPPTIIDGGAPTLAATADPGSYPAGVTLPPGAEVRFAGGPAVVRAGVGSGSSLLPGAVFANRYEIIKTLGEGGMGAMYKARDVELEREVALKVVRPELSNNPEIMQRFKQELIL